MKICLVVICGATATGKSGVAIELAQRLNSIIISADSRQVYREFDIGTAKPSLTEQKLVPHYLIDLYDPTETLTLAQYQELAQNIIHNSYLPLCPSAPLPPHPSASLPPCPSAPLPLCIFSWRHGIVYQIDRQRVKNS